MTTMILDDQFTASQLTNGRSLEAVRLFCSLKGHSSEAPGPRTLSDELDLIHAAERVLGRWPRTLSADLFRKRTEWAQKSAVNPGTMTEPSWAAPLASVRPVIEAFVDVARPQSLIGKLLPMAARVPFNVSVPVASSGGTFRWVGQGAPKPVGNMQLAGATLPVAKASGIVVLTDELVALTAPTSEVVVRRELIKGMSQYLDAQLTDPTVTAVTGVSPASITSGAPIIASAGTSAANAATDIKKLIDTFTAANPDAGSIVLLMSPSVATAMAIATNSQTLGPDGGRLFGITVHTGAIGSRVVVLDPSCLLVADDGGLDITVSNQGTIEFEQTATSPPTASTPYLSLWQAGMTAFKIDRLISWKMARPNSVLYTNVLYA